MGKCDGCGKSVCRNGDDCSYLADGNCHFCHGCDFGNDNSVVLVAHNLTNDQIHAGIQGFNEGVEAKRKPGQPRHDGYATPAKTDKLLSEKGRKKLNEGNEDEDD